MVLAASQMGRNQQKMTPLNDELQIHISVKWAIQIVVFIVSLCGAYYSLDQKTNSNASELEYMKKTFIEYEDLVDQRVGRLESYKEQELEAVNKSMLSRVLGKD